MTLFVRRMRIWIIRFLNLSLLKGARIKSVENNLQKALRRQSKNVVIDACRIKNLKDKNIEKYLISRLKQKKGIGMLIFITKNGEVIDINDRLC